MAGITAFALARVVPGADEKIPANSYIDWSEVKIPADNWLAGAGQ